MHVDTTQLAPKRTAALKRWLHVANGRLLSLQRQRQQLMANATALLQRLEQPVRSSKKSPKPGLASRLAKAG
jgi:hypothetical protein